MKHFVIGLIVVIGIIALVVIIKRIGGTTNPVPSESSSSSVSDLGGGDNEGDTLPQ